MKERINDKIEEIENYLSRLIDMAPETFEAYKTNGEKKWSCERGLEMISEASIDLAFLIIKYKKLENAIDDIGAFEILKENNIILPELCEKLQDLKKMRNILIHLYGQIDDEKVFQAISEELAEDIPNYLNAVKTSIEKKERKNESSKLR